MLRTETRARARALQLLYSADLQPDLRLRDLASGLARLTGPAPSVFERAEALATAVHRDRERLDGVVARAAENWRLDRIGVMERNILRLGIHELEDPGVPPRVAIDEAVRLAGWFAGPRAPAFVNGVLDRVARDLGRL
ncbi:MAG TPA: transcription antitermination factor NusB [Gemmatimonadales bacterium]|nr:transcription antitermination factor NusB [Gemmatimonadales bacterium]